MPNYMYLIVGGGMTADAAVHGIREVDRDGSIGLLSAEAHPPYDRPPLSKKLWKGKPLESIWRQTESQGVTLHLGRTPGTWTRRTGELPMTRGPSTATVSCSWLPAARPVACPSAASRSSTSAAWMITSGCAP